MVAGATGIDLFLLVVDAGEGPRAADARAPRRSSRLLGVERGVVAVTKVDAVDAERASPRTVEQVRELAPGDARSCRVSAADRRGARRAARRARPRGRGGRAARRAFGAARLYVDRVFSLAGAGTIVDRDALVGLDRGRRPAAGAAGRLRRPRAERRRCTARRSSAPTPASASRVGVVAEQRRGLGRGDALVEPGAYPASYRLDVALDEREPIAGGRARARSATAPRPSPRGVVRVGERYAQLRLERPLVAARGDRFVLRRETTVGGGRVLDPAPPRRPDERAPAAARPGRSAARSSPALVGAPVRIEALRAPRARSTADELDDGPRRGRAGGGVGARRRVARADAGARAGGARRAGGRARPGPARGGAPRPRAVGGGGRAAARPRRARREALPPGHGARARRAAAASSSAASPRPASSRSPVEDAELARPARARGPARPPRRRPRGRARRVRASPRGAGRRVRARRARSRSRASATCSAPRAGSRSSCSSASTPTGSRSESATSAACAARRAR